MTDLARSIVNHRLFRAFIIAVILLAGVIAGLETSPAMMREHAGRLRLLDGLILAVFAGEILLKLAAHGRRPLDYFRDGWNTFDFVIVALCLLPGAGPFAAVLRLARVLRLLRLVSALPKLQLLVGALLRSLSAMGYVALLLALLFYIYAVAGVHLFGRADAEHFGSLPVALLTLFRTVTLDNWGDFFHRALAGSHWLAVTVYFVTFIVFGTMIILNLFIGIIMNSMTEAHEEQSRRENAALDLASGEAGVLARLEAATEQLASLQATLAGLRAGLRERPAVDPGPPGRINH